MINDDIDIMSATIQIIEESDPQEVDNLKRPASAPPGNSTTPLSSGSKRRKPNNQDDDAFLGFLSTATDVRITFLSNLYNCFLNQVIVRLLFLGIEYKGR